MGESRREPRWVVAFLRGLGRHGEVRRAAFEAGIDFTTAYERRKRHPDFAAEWRRVLSERSGGGGGADPEDGEATTDAVAPGTDAEDSAGQSGVLVVQSSVAGTRQLRAGPGRWSTLKERRFLAELAASANVRRAASAARISPAAVYQRRLKDPAFARAWDQAITIGKARL